jgi:hypothetical protein
MTNELFTYKGVTYRKVNRKANVGDKVLITNAMRSYDMYRNGDVLTVDRESIEEGVEVNDISAEGNSDGFIGKKEYLTLEPIASDTEIHSHPLTLTESDVRNNPRQVIDLIANLAGRLTKLESKVERLGDSVEQAISTVARNVETWAQESERIKHVMESPAPWAEDSFVIELSKKVSEIDAKLSAVDERTQPYQQAHELFVKIAEASAKSALEAAEGMKELGRRGLTAEERREL